ncbi:alpha-xenorhabdolysin family binary toxin subunit B [Photorhabdus luminescens]|uniref:XaxB n=1 Tax=Photorhabdus luminescens subsp. sonorensis TaxID=1173677 RepID=A0A5C4RLP6_PHOLU|nr:alpha-xenorhabdolysin family binary toxin subunit B [Photorhabdus luminescens]TNH44758.1 XaxB [Photorhabdus luminescens subsp. sonorensis]
MTEIVTFPQQAVVYPEINVKTLSQAVKNIWRLSHQQKSGIEIIQEKTLRISLYSRDLDEAARASVPQLQTVLRQLPSQDYFQTITEIDTALENPELDDETRNTLLEARLEHTRNLKKDVKNVIHILLKEENQIASRIADVSNVVILERLEDRLKEEQARKVGIQDDIAQNGENKARLVVERDKIIESQDVIRQYNLADMFKDYIPDIKELDKLDIANPKKELIKQAIKQGVEIAKKILGNISKGLKYIELADARAKLDERINQLNKDCDDLKTQLEGVEQRIAGIADVHQIDKERATLLLQAAKLEQVWDIFAKQLQNAIDGKANQQNLPKIIHNQLAFLDDLAQQYHSMLLS